MTKNKYKNNNKSDINSFLSVYLIYDFCIMFNISVLIFDIVGEDLYLFFHPGPNLKLPSTGYARQVSTKRSIILLSLENVLSKSKIHYLWIVDKTHTFLLYTYVTRKDSTFFFFETSRVFRLPKSLNFSVSVILALFHWRI